MSLIGNKQIDGDVAVGRHVAIGGRAIVRGRMTVGHNLRVEGWLDARNIKGVNKGLYGSLDELKEAYPMPKYGWYALVGDTLPANLIIVDEEGEWRDTGHKVYEANLDLDVVNADIEELQDNMHDMQSNLRALESKHDGEFSSVSSKLRTEIEERKSADSKLEGELSSEVIMRRNADNDLQAALATEVQTRSDTDDELRADIDKLEASMERLLGDNASEAIDNFNEVIAFLSGIKDDETLAKLLSAMNTAISAAQTTADGASSVANVIKTWRDKLATHNYSEGVTIRQTADKVEVTHDMHRFIDGAPIEAWTETIGPASKDEAGVLTAAQCAELMKLETWRKDLVNKTYADGVTIRHAVNGVDVVHSMRNFADGKSTEEWVETIRPVDKDSAGVLTPAQYAEITDGIGDAKTMVNDHAEQVGIVAFDAIVEKHDSVIDNVATLPGGDGFLRHVVFDVSRGRFLFEVHDATYDCPGGDAYLNWPRGTEFMTADGKVRTDRVYRCGGDLYKFKDGGLVALGESGCGISFMTEGEAESMVTELLLFIL